MFAPGQSIELAALNGGFGSNSGTLFSPPYAAGTAALILQQLPNVVQWYVKQVVEESSSINKLKQHWIRKPQSAIVCATHIPLKRAGPQAVCTGTYTWSLYTLGGSSSSRTYSWYIDYGDNSENDDEFPSVTGDELTWSINKDNGPFTLGVSVLTYSDGLSKSHLVEVPFYCS